MLNKGVQCVCHHNAHSRCLKKRENAILITFREMGERVLFFYVCYNVCYVRADDSNELEFKREDMS